jgi:hypothetical protein
MDRLLHEIWDDSEGLAGLILAGEKGEAARKLFEEEGKKLVHTFYASSHFEAMTIYYDYYGWGEYITVYEYDKLPYTEWENIKGPWK